jgi:hypothetical protein
MQVTEVNPISTEDAMAKAKGYIPEGLRSVTPEELRQRAGSFMEQMAKQEKR